MNWLQFISDMVGHLAWPVVVLVVVFAVRKHLGSLAERILELSLGGASIKFGELLSKNTELIDDSPTLRLSPPSVPTGPPTAPDAPPSDETTPELPPSARPGIAPDLSDPTAADAIAVRRIYRAFDDIEGLLDAYGRRMGVKARNGQLVRMIVKRGWFGQELAEMYATLRLARNSIAHGSANIPNVAEVEEYTRQASLIAALLEVGLNKLSNDNQNRDLQ
jgi:hypothetical protein